MDNEKPWLGIGRAAERSKSLSDEIKEKMRPANRSNLISIPEPAIYDRISELSVEIDKSKQFEQAEKAELKELQILQTRYLKSIAENMDFIANQFKMTSTALITLNSTMDRMGVTFSDIQKDVEESKAINAEIFEILAKTHISNEQERLKATESLITKIKDKATLAEIPVNIMNLVDLIMQFNK